MNPQVRSEDIVVQEVFDELVIYDLKRDKVHSLNPTAAFVWQHCDGSRTPTELARLLQQEYGAPQAETLLWYTLDRLDQAHLLAERLTDTPGHRIITRRQLLKLAGVSIALLPVVASIVAPTAAQAVTTYRRQRSGSGASNSYNNCNKFCTEIQNCTGSASGSCTGSSTKTCNCCCTGCQSSTGTSC